MPYDAAPEQLSAESVLATFAAASLPCLHADAALIAKIVNARSGDVAAAVSACEGRPSYRLLLNYQGALAEAADPAVLAERLRFEADCETARGEKARTEADEFRAKHARFSDDDYALRAAGLEQTAIRNLASARRKLQAANSLSPVAA